MARIKEDYRSLTGPQKAAIMMLSLGEEQAGKLFGMMEDDEIKELSQIMANLGTVGANTPSGFNTLAISPSTRR